MSKKPIFFRLENKAGLNLLCAVARCAVQPQSLCFNIDLHARTSYISAKFETNCFIFSARRMLATDITQTDRWTC